MLRIIDLQGSPNHAALGRPVLRTAPGTPREGQVEDVARRIYYDDPEISKALGL